jgi:hypothetical protein
MTDCTLSPFGGHIRDKVQGWQAEWFEAFVKTVTSLMR